MVESKMRAKGPHPLQKHWVSPRLKMARSGQGRQRVKTFLPLNKAGKESLLPSAKIRSSGGRIRFLVRQHWGFSLSVPSALSWVLLIWHLLASSSLPSLVPPRCLRFFFSSITGATQVPLLLLLCHHWGHPVMLNRCESKIWRIYRSPVSFSFCFSFCFCS